MLLLAVGFFLVRWFTSHQQQVRTSVDHKNSAYLIEGQRIQLESGVAETSLAPDSTSKNVTQYFGNELVTDLDGDGDDDITFILSHTTGGSGTFYYAVAALATENGYIGSDGYLLGDRIAPQSVELSQNPTHKYVVVFNYVDHALGEPMATQPSVGKSVYLKMVPETGQWAVVDATFTGESNF